MCTPTVTRTHLIHTRSKGMITVFGFRKPALATATACAAAVTAVVLAAPHVSADVWNVGIPPGGSAGLAGTPYGTGRSYLATVEGTAWEGGRAPPTVDVVGPQPGLDPSGRPDLSGCCGHRP